MCYSLTVVTIKIINKTGSKEIIFWNCTSINSNYYNVKNTNVLDEHADFVEKVEERMRKVWGIDVDVNDNWHPLPVSIL